MSARTLVKLNDRYPGTSRMTRYRWRRYEPDFPDPIIINGTEYYYADELTEWEESRRRVKREREAAAEQTTDA
jgi:hypothetical protein